MHDGNGPLRAQWDLFASAIGVIGPHGAGLTNIIVMKARSVVVEVRHEVTLITAQTKNIPPFFSRMCQEQGVSGDLQKTTHAHAVDRCVKIITMIAKVLVAMRVCAFVCVPEFA